jgi:hypothetical protein
MDHETVLKDLAFAFSHVGYRQSGFQVYLVLQVFEAWRELGKAFQKWDEGAAGYLIAQQLVVQSVRSLLPPLSCVRSIHACSFFYTPYHARYLATYYLFRGSDQGALFSISASNPACMPCGALVYQVLPALVV